MMSLARQLSVPAGRAALLAAGLVFVTLSDALAQFPTPPQQQVPPCYNEFLPLRQAAEKRAQAIQAASQRKAPREEVCKLFVNFSEAEAKVVIYAEKNATWCGIPQEAVSQMKKNHGRTLLLRKRVCSAEGPAPVRRGPSLSDALRTTVVPDANTTRTGRGTFDTLTGNPLTR